MKNKKPILSVTRKDCKWDYYVGSGKGGQKRNKTANCARCTHEASGAVGKSEQGRSQFQNRKLAFKQMAESKKFKNWIKIETARIMGRESDIKRKVEEAMNPKNLMVETKDENGNWKISKE